MPIPHAPPCDDIIVLKEKVAALEAWRASTEIDLKEIHDVISQIKLLISFSIGGSMDTIIVNTPTKSEMPAAYLHPAQPLSL